MAKKKVRIYKDPKGQGAYKSKLKNFLFIAQQGAQVNQQQAVIDKIVSYVYNAIIHEEEDPEDVYEALIKMKVDQNLVSNVIEYVLQGIENEQPASRETVSRPKTKEQLAEEAFALEQVKRDEEDEVLMDQIIMDEGPSLEDPQLDEQLFFTEEELPEQQKGGINVASEVYANDENKIIRSIFDPRYKHYKKLRKENDRIKDKNKDLEKAKELYHKRWENLDQFNSAHEWKMSKQFQDAVAYLKKYDIPQYANTVKYHKAKWEPQVQQLYNPSDFDAAKESERDNYERKLPRHTMTNKETKEYVKWVVENHPEYVKKNNIESLLKQHKDNPQNLVIRSMLNDKPWNKTKGPDEPIVKEAPIMDEIVINRPVTPQEEFVYKPTVIPELPMMDLDPQVIPLDMQPLELEEMDELTFPEPRSLRQDKREARKERKERRKGNRREWWDNIGKPKPRYKNLNYVRRNNRRQDGGETLFNIENKLTDSKGNLMNAKEYVKKYLKGFQPGGAQGTVQNDENSPWTINQETWKRDSKTKALVDYSQKNVAKEQEKQRLEQEYAQLMAQREQLANFIPQGGEEIIDMTSIQEELPQAQFGGRGDRRVRRMIPRGFGISPLNVKNIDVRRTGLFGRPKEYSMEIAPFDYAMLAKNPLLRSIYNIDALTPKVIERRVMDYQPIKEKDPIKETIEIIEKKEEEKKDKEVKKEKKKDKETRYGAAFAEPTRKSILSEKPKVKKEKKEKKVEKAKEEIKEEVTIRENIEEINVTDNIAQSIDMTNPAIRNQYLNYLKESTGVSTPQFDFPNSNEIQKFINYQKLLKKQTVQDDLNKMYGTEIYKAPTISGRRSIDPMFSSPYITDPAYRDRVKKAEEWRPEYISNLQQGGFTDSSNPELYKFTYGGDEEMQFGGWGRVWRDNIRGSLHLNQAKRRGKRQDRQQARGRRQDFRRANRMSRNQMQFPTLTGPRGINNAFSANPAFGYAGSWSKPMSGFYNKRTGNPWEGQLSPDAQVKNIDVTKSGIFGRPKKYSITYGQKTGNLVKKKQTPQITLNDNSNQPDSNYVDPYDYTQSIPFNASSLELEQGANQYPGRADGMGTGSKSPNPFIEALGSDPRISTTVPYNADEDYARRLGYDLDDDLEVPDKRYGGCSTCPQYNFGGVALGEEVEMTEDEIAAYMQAGGVVEFI